MKRDITPLVSSENPYSRLMALQQMNIVPNYATIREKRVLLLGVGGVGAVVAEHLVRCGVGTLVLVDRDVVELANMNRSLFLPRHADAKMSKVAAAAEVLAEINPDTTCIATPFDLVAAENEPELCRMLREADVAICCVDNFAARLAVNRCAAALRRMWIETGVAESATRGHVQLVIPGCTACYACCPALGAGAPEVRREGTCAASLPSTNAIVASIAVNFALKLLLRFGRAPSYVSVDILDDFYRSSTDMRPNPECACDPCVAAQREFAARCAELGSVERAHPLFHEPSAEERERAAAEAAKRQEQQQERRKQFGFEVVKTGVAPAPAAKPAAPAVAVAPSAAGQVEDSVEDLMKQLASVSH